MSEYSIVEAKNQLSSLIDRALAGETVVITRHGTPVAEIRPVAACERPMTPADLDWIAQRRASPRMVDVGAENIVSRMREEDDERLLRR